MYAISCLVEFVKLDFDISLKDKINIDVDNRSAFLFLISAYVTVIRIHSQQLLLSFPLLNL